MSLPWKKSGRISRFMSEFQQSPKRGGSLVVETGFPTSLIDLFVKNRDRLKKSSSNNKRLKRQTQTAPNASLPINPDAILEKPVARKTVRSKTDEVNFIGGGLTAEKNGCVCGGSAFVLIAFKVFIVAAFAFSTKKKLTIGITLSALALLLTELVVARVLTRFTHCDTDARKGKPAVSINDENAISCGKIAALDVSSDHCGEETQVPKSHKTEPVAESKDLKIRDLLMKDHEKSKSKSSRLKSKIVKKLRSYRKKKKTVVIKEETLSEVSSFVVSEDKTEITEPAERDEEGLNPPLIESKGDNTNGIVLIVIVLTGLLSGKILAIGLTLSSLFLRFGAAKNSGLCI
ncbi:hypothetical protein EUTSA_v10003311mg [Eutrema salsugineum]|uniref:Ethylene-responsive nuclear protein n=1 Tax=Eutrema salsugineum TaxID=72664 RepID=V4LLG3_EUTSA|nr:uncharacterized protein LOC18020623 [Eutrema salsugineum]ESQ44559.1 hypothetical protein EUTSA_v10003311mg [Eutrema salsugineum]